MSSDINQILYLLNVAQNLIEIGGLFIIIISTIGNLCNCFVFLSIPALNKHPNALFVIGSSIGSLFLINLGTLPSIIQILNGINLLNESLFWCKINVWLTYSSGCFSFMCNCFAAFGQCLITSPKLRWQRLLTRLKAQLMILFTIIIYLFIFIPLPIYNIHIKISSTTFICTNSLPIINNYVNYWMMIGFYFLPILLILILFCLTWYNLRQLLRRRRSLEGAVTRMMLMQMIIILSSGIPASGYVMYMTLTQYSSKTQLRIIYEYIISLTLVLFTYLTNGISFWVYLFVSKIFRKNLKDFILTYKLFKNRTRPISISTTKTNIHR